MPSGRLTKLAHEEIAPNAAVAAAPSLAPELTGFIQNCCCFRVVGGGKSEADS
jgi:hypothetical protein